MAVSENMKTVSIIIPVYNSEQTLSKCLDSVLASTYKNIEVLLLDDGSKDNSLSICREYAENDSRIRVFHHDNHGVSYTRNRGLDEATGDYIMFVDSDDTISSTWVGAYAEAIEKKSVNIVIGALTRTKENGKIEIRGLPNIGVLKNAEIWKMMGKECYDAFGYVANKLYSASVIRDNLIRFNEKMTVQEDLDFFISVLEKSGDISVIEESGYYYDYVENKHKVFLLDLLNNKMRIFNHIEKEIKDKDYEFGELVKSISGNVYHILRKTNNKAQFKTNCIELQKYSLDRCLQYLRKINEKTFVFYCVCNRKYNLIWLYFRVRCIPERIRNFIK